MRIFLTFLLCTALGNSLLAQTIERQVLANAGGTATLPDNYTISWTLGESFVAVRAAAIQPVLYFTEGFQQPESSTVPTIELPDDDGQIVVSPNPAGNTLLIALPQRPARTLYARLCDANGHMLRTADLTDLATALDLTGLPAAWYILSITDGKQWLRTVQVVKR